MKKRILAVDDDPAALRALRQILTQKGYDVASSGCGRGRRTS
jgi:PleD family two-component response regulator